MWHNTADKTQLVGFFSLLPDVQEPLSEEDQETKDYAEYDPTPKSLDCIHRSIDRLISKARKEISNGCGGYGCAEHVFVVVLINRPKKFNVISDETNT